MYSFNNIRAMRGANAAQSIAGEYLAGNANAQSAVKQQPTDPITKAFLARLIAASKYNEAASAHYNAAALHSKIAGAALSMGDYDTAAYHERLSHAHAGYAASHAAQAHTQTNDYGLEVL